MCPTTQTHVRQCRYVQCGRTFEVSGLSARNKRYCSPRCERAKRAKLPRLPWMQTCVVCEENFWAKNLKKYCGPSCGSRARKALRLGVTVAELQAVTHCGGCGVDLSTLPGRLVHVDHDHVSGRYRGTLCHNCNLALGHAQDSQEILLGLIDYLERYEEQRSDRNQSHGRRGDALEARSSAAGEISFGLGEAAFERSH